MKHDLAPEGLARWPKFGFDAGAIVLWGAIAALYFRREILIPFAFARLHVGRIVSVLTTVLVSIAVAGGIGWIIANQLVDVANQLPLYRRNIHAKIEAFHLPVTGQIGQPKA